MPKCMWQQPQRDCTNVASVGSVQKKKMAFKMNTIAKLQFDDKHIDEDKKYERMLVGNLLLADHF